MCLVYVMPGTFACLLVLLTISKAFSFNSELNENSENLECLLTERSLDTKLNEFIDNFRERYSIDVSSIGGLESEHDKNPERNKVVCRSKRQKTKNFEEFCKRRGPETHRTSDWLSPLPMSKEFLMTTAQIIMSEGYPVDKHYVRTNDGYILGIHRIPSSPYSKTKIKGKKRVVLLVHGIFSNSKCFVTYGRRRSLGYLLSDAGYDVWLFNSRGTRYSRNHTQLDPDKDLSFWQFSLDEIAAFDVPAVYRYILRVTGANDLFYVGYSQGAKVFYFAASEDPYIRNMTRMGFVFGAVCHNIPNPLVQINSRNPISSLWMHFEKHKMGELGKVRHKTFAKLYHLCRLNMVFYKMCAFFLHVKYPQLKYDGSDPDLVASILSMADSASARQLSQVNGQRNGVGLAKFDYFNNSTNMLRYGQLEPPSYDTTKMTNPIAFYWGEVDPFTPEKYVRKQLALLPNLRINYHIPGFKHLDFLFHPQIKELLYDSIIDTMNKN